MENCILFLQMWLFFSSKRHEYLAEEIRSSEANNKFPLEMGKENQKNIRGSQENIGGSRENIRGSRENIRGSRENIRGSQENIRGSRPNSRESRANFSPFSLLSFRKPLLTLI